MLSLAFLLSRVLDRFGGSGLGTFASVGASEGARGAFLEVLEGARGAFLEVLEGFEEECLR